MRTTQDIFDSMVAAKDNDPRLASLTSSSSTAIWRLLFWVSASIMALFLNMLEGIALELEGIRDSAVPGTSSWYRNKAFEWQWGHTLQIDPDGRIGYATEDLPARLVKRAAIQELPDGSLLIKVATATGPLSAPELLSVSDYFRELHFAGTLFSVLSLPADKLRVTATVYFDPQVGASSCLAAVQDSIDAYLAALPFDGVIHVSKVVDAIQASAGVQDVLLSLVEADNGTGYQPVPRLVQPLAGWFVIDPAFPLSTTLTLTPNV